MKEIAFNSTVAGTGLFISAWLGGWDSALKWLMVCMILDYATGFMAAWKQKQIDSDIMFWGGIRKASILVVIIICVMFDELFGNPAPIFRTMAIYFYVGREVLSIAENLGVLGVPWPEFISDALVQLQQKSASKKSSNGI